MDKYNISIEYIDHSISSAQHCGTIESALELAADLVKRGLFDPVNIWSITIEQME